MDKAINKILTDYTRLVQEKYPDLISVYVFGSYVKGNQNENSDIDLALIFKNLDDSQRFDIQVELIILASQIDNRIEPHPVSYFDFNSDNPFTAEIKNTGFEFMEVAK